MILAYHSSEIMAQQDISRNKDTLIIGGMYRMGFTDGSALNGELIYIEDSGIGLKIEDKDLFISGEAILSFEFLTKIKENNLPNEPVDKKSNKFKLIGSVQTGLSIPTSNFKNLYKTSSGFQIAVYKPNNTKTAYGFEFQYNSFHNAVFYNTKETYSYNKIESENYNSSLFKINFLYGDLRNNIDFVFYLLFGIGMQFGSEGAVTSTIVTHTSSTTSYVPGGGNALITYGLGFGGFYKVAKMIGINLEMQYDHLSNDNLYLTGEENKFNGLISIKAGIMFTNF